MNRSDLNLVLQKLRFEIPLSLSPQAIWGSGLCQEFIFLLLPEGHHLFIFQNLKSLFLMRPGSPSVPGPLGCGPDCTGAEAL